MENATEELARDTPTISGNVGIGVHLPRVLTGPGDPRDGHENFRQKRGGQFGVPIDERVQNHDTMAQLILGIFLLDGATSGASIYDGILPDTEGTLAQ